MARTTEEILAEIQGNVATYLPGLSSSQAADWLKFAAIAAQAINKLELIIDSIQGNINNQLSVKQPGTTYWLALKALEFQYGDNLQVNSNGVVSYPVIDESKRIVAKSAAKEETDSSVTLKVAKIDDGDLVPLTDAEKLAFSNYIEKIKYAGTLIDVVSEVGDVVKYTIDVYYNPLYSTDTINANLVAALDAFKESIGFDGMFYKTEFIKYLTNAEGVVTIDIDLLTGTSGGVTESIVISRELVAGYFNYDATSAFTLISV